jgi:endonuclease
MAPRYGKPLRDFFKDMVSEWRLEPGRLFTRQQVLSWFKARHPEIRPATIPAYLIKLSTNAPGRVPYHVDANGADDRFYQVDSQNYRLYDRASDPAPIHEKTDGNGTAGPTNGGGDDDADEVEPPVGSNRFAYEKDLQSFLVRNLGLVEAGLRLYEDEDITGVEFPVGRRFIDILAEDKKKTW